MMNSTDLPVTTAVDPAAPAPAFSKTDEACRRLADQVRRLTPHSKLPRVTELRSELGVSLTTLDAALRKLEDRNLIYRVQGSGIFVSPRASAGIALICDPSYFRGASHSPFWDMLLEESRARAQAHGEQFSCHFSQAADDHAVAIHEGLAQQILDGRVQGVLGVGLTKAAAQWLQEHHVPIVAFAGTGHPVVCLDEEALVTMGVQNLARQGCRRIEYWTPMPQWILIWMAHSDRKVAAFERAALSSGFDLHQTKIRDNRHLLSFAAGADRPSQTSESHQEQGYRIALEVFSADRSQWPDGLLIDDDLMTSGVMLGLQKLNVKVGIDVQITSHANRGSTVLMGHDNLTLLEFDPADVVATMFDELEKQIDGQKSDSDAISISPQLRSPHTQ
jgi:DNA-binding LacI/PurR family transcriptional regulator